MAMRVTLLLCAALALVPGWAAAEPTGTPAERAQAYADLGYAAYQHEDWNKAIEMYLESYKLSSTADLLFNIAVIYDRKLGNKAMAIEYFRKHNAAADPNPDLVAKANRRIESLTHEAPVGDTGRSGPTAPPPPPDRGANMRMGGIATATAGVIALGVGIGFGIAAISKMDQAKTAGCDSTGCPNAAAAALERTANSRGNDSTIGVVAGGVLVAAGVTLYVLAPSKPSRTESATATLMLRPTLTPNTAGIGLAGTF
jgi:tetratricopeptide (TPR) repeat protein